MSDPGADYRSAKQAVVAHRRRQVAIETERIGLIRSRADLADVDSRLAAVIADVDWCRALVVACGETVKGESLDDVIARHDARGEV